MDSYESEERTRLNAPLFEAPGSRHGTAQGKPAAPKAWARRDEKRYGPSMGTERKHADKHAAETHPNTPAGRAAALRAKLTGAQLDAMSPARKRQNLSGGRPKVWQLESWMDGGDRCPDERLEWEG